MLFRSQTRVEPGLPLIRCDAVLMLQMLDNLLDNALKYSRSDTPVELVLCRQAGHVVFAVRDRGDGVPLEWQERIFEMFQRGPSAPGGSMPDAPSRRGAGVGLAVCRAIAQAHGGALRYRPRAHGGASFEFWLPESTPPDDLPEAVSVAR